MTPATFLQIAVEPAFGLLPSPMRSIEAKALLVAIALQESQLARRRQFAGGTAKSYFQFELTGIEGVLASESMWSHARAICVDLNVLSTPTAVYLAVEYHDVLACVFARLLLWTCARRLPGKADADEGWRQYLDLWRPGKPRPETWAPNFIDAWRAVQR